MAHALAELAIDPREPDMHPIEGEPDVPARTRPDLVLRPWSVSDAEGLREAIDEDVSHIRPWLSWSLDEPATLERTRERLRDWEHQHRAGRSLRFAILNGDDASRILGGASLAHRLGPGSPDVGYWVRASATGRGIAAAAASAVIVFAFAADSTGRVIVQCDVGNERSAALARALGFRPIEEATTRYPDGSPRPVWRFELTRGDFESAGIGIRRRAGRVRLVAAQPDE